MQILLPKETGSGQPISQKWFEGLLKELTEKFGGATSFVRAPGQGLWESGGAIERDNIAVIEVMAERAGPPLLAKSCARGLEHELSQEEIVIRAQEIVRL